MVVKSARKIDSTIDKVNGNGLMGKKTGSGKFRNGKGFLFPVVMLPLAVLYSPQISAEDGPSDYVPPVQLPGVPPAPEGDGIPSLGLPPPPSQASQPAAMPITPPQAVLPVQGGNILAPGVQAPPVTPLPSGQARPYIPPVPDINENLLQPQPVPGNAPRSPGHASGFDIPSSGKGIQPNSLLQVEHENDSVYENMKVQKQREKDIENRTRRKPNARSLRYRPLENDPSLDPLDKGYENWLKSVRLGQGKPEDIDPEYERFVKDISVLLFSLGQKQMPVETKEMLEQIPADSLKDPARSLEIINPVAIDHGDSADPFPPADQKYDETVGPDTGLNIQIKSKGEHIPTLLEQGYDALMSGQVEGAVAIYKQVVAQDPESKQGLFGLATSYHRSGQLAEARRTYISLLKSYPDYWPAMNNFLVLAGEEAPEDALKELRELEQINPEFSPIAAQIGMVYLQIGRLEDSVKYLSRAVILAPDNLGYRYNLAVVLDHSGYKAQAARLYQQLLEAGGEGKELPESKDRIRERLAFIRSSQQFQ